MTQKEAKEDAKVTDQTPAQTSKVEEVKTAQIAASSPANIEQQPAKQEVKEEPKAEVKAEVPKAEPVKFTLNLEQTLKSVEDLHRKSIQRLALKLAQIK